MKYAALALALAAALPVSAPAAEFAPLSAVRLEAGPLRDAQERDRRYLMALDADRLLAPFRREAGLAQPKPSYGNWESTGLDGHMAGHALSALALMAASTGDGEVRARLDHMVAELKRCQDAPRDALMTGYLGGIPRAKPRGAPWHAASCRPTTSPSTAAGCPGTTCTRPSPACATRICTAATPRRGRC